MTNSKYLDIFNSEYFKLFNNEFLRFKSKFLKIFETVHYYLDILW